MAGATGLGAVGFGAADFGATGWWVVNFLLGAGLLALVPVGVAAGRCAAAGAGRTAWVLAPVPTLKAATTCAKRRACSLIAPAAAVASSTRAAFCWVIWSRLATA